MVESHSSHSKSSGGVVVEVEVEEDGVEEAMV